MKQIIIKMRKESRDAINEIFYIIPPKRRGMSINLFIEDSVNIRLMAIAEKFTEHYGIVGPPRRSKSKVIEAILQAFAASHKAGKFGSKDLGKVYEIAATIITDLKNEGIDLGLTKSVFVSALVQYLCKTQKMSDKLFQNLYKD